MERIGTVYNATGDDRARRDGAKALVGLLEDCFGIGVTVEAKYSRNAGCSCGCSPGYSLRVEGDSPTLREFKHLFADSIGGRGAARAEFFLSGSAIDSVRRIADGRRSFNIDKTAAFVAWAAAPRRALLAAKAEADERLWAELRVAARRREAAEERERVTEIDIDGRTFAIEQQP